MAINKKPINQLEAIEKKIIRNWIICGVIEIILITTLIIINV